MNIIEFTRQFQSMEMKERLFERKTSDEIYFWDIVRYDVFNLIFRDYLNEQFTDDKQKTSSKRKITFNKILRGIITYQRDMDYFQKYRNSKYMFFCCSRNFIDNKDIDFISKDYLKIIEDQSFIIETFDSSVNNSYFKNIIFKYQKKMSKLFFRKNDVYNINEIINGYFNISIDIDELLNSILDNFRFEKKFYLNFLRKTNPQIVFFVQNGIQKALMHSCNELNITSVELQHGIINFSHPAYSFPKGVEMYLNGQVIVPDVFFTFSKFWTDNTYFPVRKNIVMGNSYYGSLACSLSQGDRKNEITFVSANIYQKDIDRYISYLANNNSRIIINLKLHPNQINDKKDLCSRYKMYSNIKVYYNEVTLLELFSRSKEVIMVTSTAAYEAIQVGCNVGIIKTEMSYNIEDLFNHPNVRLLEQPEDILINKNNKSYQTVFFEKFNDTKFLKFIDEIK